MRKIAKLIYKFINGDCDVIPSDMFSYKPIDEIITFCMVEPKEANIEWKKFLKETHNFDLTSENVFALSILHELGHHYTVDLFSDEDWESYATQKTLEDLEGSELHQAYFNLPNEQIATAWAVELYRANPTYMKAWNQRFNCALRHYEKKTHKKTSFLDKKMFF